MRLSHRGIGGSLSSKVPCSTTSFRPVMIWSFSADARELARVEKVIPLGQGLAGVAAFEIIGRIEQVLAARLALAARERAEHVEAASDGADEPTFDLAVGDRKSTRLNSSH